MKKIYPRTGDTQTVYLNAVVKDPSIKVGDYTIYNDFVSVPLFTKLCKCFNQCRKLLSLNYRKRQKQSHSQRIKGG